MEEDFLEDDFVLLVVLCGLRLRASPIEGVDKARPSAASRRVIFERIGRISCLLVLFPPGLIGIEDNVALRNTHLHSPERSITEYHIERT